ncbi:hypothetical protein DFO66_101236 [Brevibacterium sanguinis]|uniref:Uncharacterized protein n=2 Tax=Brevibacterium TaxID=1696 RepID=A0A366IQE7_9MICO|nr:MULTISPECIES: hypothetical protein [Brevibacterium]RBP68012.1 hypothetical protein DFO66_101236 [Brevibacterium sanguinis]RBP74571.1 hypothetical protein DFO65_101293 [Brevibacterium celere]
MVLAVLVGSALSVVGTDEVSETPPFTVSEGAHAIVLDEAIVPYSGTDATLEATAANGQELFIGTASGVDVDSYLDGVAQVQISDVRFPDEAVHRSIPGEPAPEAPVAEQDWWTSKDTGNSVAKTFNLDADPEVLVIAPADPEQSLEGTTVTMKMRVEGVFGWSLIGIAVAIILFGAALYFGLRWWNGRIRPKKKDMNSSDDHARQPDPARSAPPGQRAAKRTRTMRIGTTAVLASGLALSGCGVLPIAQPADPHITPYERTAVRPGEAGKYMTEYTESLDQILADGGTGLERIQGAPLIDRTRAQIQIAKKAKQKLAAPNFTEVVAGGPSFEEYPMWFYAFGTTDGDEKMTQIQLVTRESAAARPIVRAASYIPAEQAPTLLANGRGAVETAPKDFTDSLAPSADTIAKYLVDGKADKSLGGLEEGGFTSFRDYLGELRGKESGFDQVDAKCSPYTDLDFASMTLKTEAGAIGMGEVRCTLTIKVPQDFSLDLGDTIEAVKTNDKDGDTVEVDTAHPYVLVESADALTAMSVDWDIISSRVV